MEKFDVALFFPSQISGSEHRLDDILDTYDPGDVGGFDRRAWLRMVAPFLATNGHRLQLKRELKSFAMLLVGLVAFIVAGGYVMSIFEASYESDAHAAWKTIVGRFGADLTEAQEEELSSVIEVLVNNGVCSVPECDVYNDVEAASTEDIFECKTYHSNWDLESSIFYMFTIVSTVGYGLFTPSTCEGQLFTCLWAIPGMLIFSQTLASMLAVPFSLRELLKHKGHHDGAVDREEHHDDNEKAKQPSKQRRRGGKFKKREGGDNMGPPALLTLRSAKVVVQRIREEMDMNDLEDKAESCAAQREDLTAPSSPRFYKREPSGALSPQGGKDPSFFIEAQKQREAKARSLATIAKLEEGFLFNEVRSQFSNRCVKCQENTCAPVVEPLAAIFKMLACLLFSGKTEADATVRPSSLARCSACLLPWSRSRLPLLL